MKKGILQGYDTNGVLLRVRIREVKKPTQVSDEVTAEGLCAPNCDG